MGISSRRMVYSVLLGLIVAVSMAVPAWAAEPYESDPTFSLIGSCVTIPEDPVLDPSCPYPPPPGGPSGRFKEPRAIAIDQHGNQYIASFEGGDKAKGRVDVFDDEGRFITEFAAPEARTAAIDTKGNLYIFRDFGDVVRYEPSEYKPEEGKIKYEKAAVLVASGPFNGAVVVDTDPAHLDQVIVSRPNTIIRYKSAADAEPNGVIESYEPPGLGPWPEAMAIDSQGRRLFVTYCKNANEECGVRVLDADDPEKELAPPLDGLNTPAKKFAAFSGRLPIAVDEGTGDLLVADPSPKKVYQFDEDYEFLSELVGLKELEIGGQIAISNGTRDPGAEACKYPNDPPPPAGDACNRHYLFVAMFKSAGRVAAFHPPGQTAPVIEGVATPSIGQTEAELAATIFPGGVETEYHFEITTVADWEANGFTGATVIPGGTISAESLATEVSSFATGLTPGETYRFRAVAENSKGKGKEEGQNEATFATYDDASISSPGSCPNEALRVKASALLPDCRAYELVTPADTSGRPPKGTGFLGSVFSTLQASPAGDAVTFRIEGGSLPGGSGVGSFNGGDPYVSRRGDSGWSSELAGVTGTETTKSAAGSQSPDQDYAFWRSLGEGPLEPPAGTFFSEYFYYPDGHSELIGRGSEGSEPVSIGKLITENATHIVFQTINLAPLKAVKLEPNAPPEGTRAVYDRTIDPVTGAEQTHVVSLLPGDVTPEAGEHADYVGASKDGEGIAFVIGKDTFSLGTLYLRVGNETTYEIGEEVEFAGVGEGGGRIFYVEGGDLLAFDVASEEVVAFSSTGDVTPVNVSTDGTRAYFVSTSVLGGTNPEGDSALAGEQNLYLSEDGALSFVATVTDRDVEGEPEPLGIAPYDGLGLWTEEVGDQVARDPSRLNPDGSVLLFQSRAEITGYQESEFPQIYRYDSVAGELQCISCIPTGAKAIGGARLETYGFDSFAPQPFSPSGFVPNLNPQGTRVFFDSTEALVSTDTDEVNDVYEWEAQGTGSCGEPEGCVYLISSGQSERDNFLYGHSTDGRDVFFTTGDRLTGWDSAGGAVSIYDARVNGGFREPEEGEDCVGDGCRPQVSPTPILPAPAVPTPGANDQVPSKAKSCPKGKRKVKKNGKVRCVKKKKTQKAKGGKAKQRTGANRGAGK